MMADRDEYEGLFDDLGVVDGEKSSPKPPLEYKKEEPEPAPTVQISADEQKALDAIIAELRSKPGEEVECWYFRDIIRPILDLKAVQKRRILKILAPAIENGTLEIRDPDPAKHWPFVRYADTVTVVEDKSGVKPTKRSPSKVVDIDRIIAKVKKMQADPEYHYESRYMDCGHLKWCYGEVTEYESDENGKLKMVGTGEYTCLACHRGEYGDPTMMKGEYKDQPVPERLRRTVEKTLSKLCWPGYCYHPETGVYIGGIGNNCRKEGPIDPKTKERVICPACQKIAKGETTD